MSTRTYMCPCCGAPLAYGAASGKLECASCGNSYELEAMEAMRPEDNRGGVQFDLPQETFNAAEADEMQAYTCSSCGAELMTEGTTTATECPYCGSPTILPDRLDRSVRPEKVIPFTVTKEDVQQQFSDYFKGKLLMPKVFLQTRNRISEMRKLYVPYWLFDCDAEGSIVYNAERRHTERRGEYEITHTDHYAVRREGVMAFENIPVDGSEKLDNKISESLEPYDLDAAVSFQPAVLAGAMADHADVNAQECEKRAVERVETSVAGALRNTVNGYDSVTERSRSIHAEGGKVTPVLMPVWLLTTEKEGKTYTFAINGQTGKLTCDVPADKKKSVGWGVGVFAGVFALIALVLVLLDMFSGMAALIAAIVALVVSLITLGVLKGKLKQAVHNDTAEDYVKQGSFKLTGRHDHFLYRTTTRRRIESNKKD